MRSLFNILINFLFGSFLLQGCSTAFSEINQESILVRSAVSSPDISITLRKSFIEAYKNRATIEVMATIEKADIMPHPLFLDGDFHIAIRVPDIGLPIVAEIKNAAFQREAINLIRSIERSARPVRLTGTWRLWSEHAGGSQEVQGTSLSPIESTNPEHVFEIHPVTFVDDLDLLESFEPVEGYRPGKADIVFRSFETIKCRIIPKESTITIVTRKYQLNDTEFIMEIKENLQQIVRDGRFVDAAVLSLKGDRLVNKVRMMFVKNTLPEMLVKNLKRGGRLHVFGLPRIDLAEVDRRAGHFKDNPELLNLNLPYEIIVVGVYKDQVP